MADHRPHTPADIVSHILFQSDPGTSEGADAPAVGAHDNEGFLDGVGVGEERMPGAFRLRPFPKRASSEAELVGAVERLDEGSRWMPRGGQNTQHWELE